MATTEKGIYYPNDGTKSADVLADFKEMAESIDKTIEDEVKANIYDDTEIKKDISDIQQEQTQQNKDIENLQTNDNKQDELISKLKNVALNAETEEAKSLYVTDVNKFGSLEVLGNNEQKTREGYNILDYLPNIVTSRNGLTIDKDEETGYITVNGTPTANYTVISVGSAFQLNDILEDGETYTLWQENHAENDDKGMYLQVRIAKISDGSEQYINSSKTNKTFTVDKSLYAYTTSIQTGTIAQAGTFTNYKNRYMIYKGTDSKEFELYSASPSPGYSSPVKCLGSNKQLFDKSTAVEGLLQGDGSLSNSDNNYSTSDFIKVVPKKSYYKTITGSSRFKFFDEEKSPISSTYNDLIDPTKAQSFEIPENAHYIRFTFLKTYIDEIKIEEGTEATSYSPYGQGSTLISKINKNFLNLNNLEVANNNGIDAYNIDNANQITLKNKAKNSGTPYSYSFQAFKLNLPAGNYNLSAKVNTNSSNYRIIIRGKKNGNNITSVAVLNQVGNDGNFNIDYSKCDEYTIELYANQAYVEQLVTTTYYDIQIEKGNTATEYVEHKQEDYLLYIQQEMLKGDYFAKEEDGWKEVHGFGKYVFDGTESYIKSSLSDDNYLRTYTNGNTISSSIMEMDGKMFATRYNAIGIYSSTTTDNRIACRPQLHTQISTEFLTENTAEAYKALLEQWKNEGDPLVIYYELQTPTKLSCTEEQSTVLEELNNLDLFEGVNNIITAEDIALLKLKYALDVETYVDNKLNTINQQILEIAEGN